MLPWLETSSPAHNPKKIVLPLPDGPIMEISIDDFDVIQF
jgi:hypothetical protein